MKTAMLGILVISSLSCSGSDEPEACDLAHRDGTYLLSYTERAGSTCGALPDTIARLDPDAPLASGCSLTAADEVSADQCDLTRSLVCAINNPDGTIEGVGITKERDGGARFEGLYTITIRDETGAFFCSGTYNASAVRQ